MTSARFIGSTPMTGSQSSVASSCREQFLSAGQARAAIADGSSVVMLAGDLSLRPVRVMNGYRVEFDGFFKGMRDWLKSIGLFSEIIKWKTRLFPINENGFAKLDRLAQRHRLIDHTSRLCQGQS